VARLDELERSSHGPGDFFGPRSDSPDREDPRLSNSNGDTQNRIEANHPAGPTAPIRVRHPRSDSDALNLKPKPYVEGYPESTYHSEDRYVGTRALWLKVIIRAVFDWVSYRDSTNIQKLKLAESARNWLFERSELFNGFENVCFQIDLSPQKVRVWARSISKDQVAKIEHLDRDSGGSETLEVKLLGKNCSRDEDEEL
jgi:hypothetical protein